MKLTIIGISGNMGSGKDTVANRFVPKGYRKLAYSDPLYRMAKLVYQSRLGEDKTSKFELYNLILSVYGGPMSSPPFETITELVGQLIRMDEDLGLATIPLRNNVKPREFLQSIGTYLRQQNPNCFSKYMKTRILSILKECFDEYQNAVEHDDTKIINYSDTAEGVVGIELTRFPEPHVKIIITDIRYQNELDVISDIISSATNIYSVEAKQALILLELDKDELVSRIVSRDSITPEAVLKSLEHETENSLPDRSMYDIAIDASKSPEEIYSIIDNGLNNGFSKTVPTLTEGLIDLSKYRSTKES
jgi:cytidylate kinase